ncbi:VOC family protein [Kibdelosporangium philippinense]|uniref:VOC family protein n=1 Tax=Kibdelosporangium philippinense TaxID=211113 RepID=A0ABS8ZGJ0_9PSEU|nr:VOC family protein [Kibdelosporangium philippinense]MCE7006148.1 VOC family protein [Kibdelosporangium philippinense]
MIRGVNQVVLYVSDQQRAKQFWVEKMGFTVAEDSPYGEKERWIAVASPDGNMRMVLSLRQPGYEEPKAPDGMPTSNIMFYSDDVQRTYAELTAKGVNFPTAPSKMFFGWWSVFEDDEGTRYALGEQWGTNNPL